MPEETVALSNEGSTQVETATNASVAEGLSPESPPPTQDSKPSNVSAFEEVLGESPTQAEASSEKTEGDGLSEDTPQETVLEFNYDFVKDLALRNVEFDAESPLMQTFQEVAKDVSLKPEQIEKLVSACLQSMDEQVGEVTQSFQQQQEALANQTLDTLKSEWGVDVYEQKMPRVSQLLKSTFSEEALEVLRSSPDLGSSVALIKGFAEIADRFGETAFVEGSFSTTTDAYTYGSSAEFMAQHRDILMNPNHEEYGAYTERYNKLIMQTHKLPVA